MGRAVERERSSGCVTQEAADGGGGEKRGERGEEEFEGEERVRKGSEG